MEIDLVLNEVKKIELKMINLFNELPAGARLLAPDLFTKAQAIRVDLTKARAHLQAVRNSEALKIGGSDDS